MFCGVFPSDRWQHCFPTFFTQPATLSHTLAPRTQPNR